MSIGAPYRHESNIEEYSTTVMAANLTLKLEDADKMYLDGDGARNVVLPNPVGAAGAQVTIVNTGGETLTVQDVDASTTNGTVATAEIGVFYSDGVVWNHLTGVA